MAHSRLRLNRRPWLVQVGASFIRPEEIMALQAEFLPSPSYPQAPPPPGPPNSLKERARLEESIVATQVIYYNGTQVRIEGMSPSRVRGTINEALQGYYDRARELRREDEAEDLGPDLL